MAFALQHNGLDNTELGTFALITQYLFRKPVLTPTRTRADVPVVETVRFFESNDNDGGSSWEPTKTVDEDPGIWDGIEEKMEVTGPSFLRHNAASETSLHNDLVNKSAAKDESREDEKDAMENKSIESQNATDGNAGSPRGGLSYWWMLPVCVLGSFAFSAYTSLAERVDLLQQQVKTLKSKPEPPALISRGTGPPPTIISPPKSESSKQELDQAVESSLAQIIPRLKSELEKQSSSALTNLRSEVTAEVVDSLAATLKPQIVHEVTAAVQTKLRGDLNKLRSIATKLEKDKSAAADLKKEVNEMCRTGSDWVTRIENVLALEVGVLKQVVDGLTSQGLFPYVPAPPKPSQHQQYQQQASPDSPDLEIDDFDLYDVYSAPVSDGPPFPSAAAGQGPSHVANYDDLDDQVTSHQQWQQQTEEQPSYDELTARLDAEFPVPGGSADLEMASELDWQHAFAITTGNDAPSEFTPSEEHRWTGSSPQLTPTAEMDVPTNSGVPNEWSEFLALGMLALERASMTETGNEISLESPPSSPSSQRGMASMTGLYTPKHGRTNDKLSEFPSLDELYSPGSKRALMNRTGPSTPVLGGVNELPPFLSGYADEEADQLESGHVNEVQVDRKDAAGAAVEHMASDEDDPHDAAQKENGAKDAAAGKGKQPVQDAQGFNFAVPPSNFTFGSGFETVNPFAASNPERFPRFRG
ncbi:hypothetical protein BDV95DRAFT_618869 [Massariosphaeria phaeospora]|uniref:Uncharacterized protein n=1 Tax=Massariosphaeria phaeospora TaxID=100035 RepID=A0A7C8MBP6_9PLEO|nr:hypothetical protein BDV95DRAFT_618869 [Massariosphaeria phaeospora]